ncbi:MAG: cobalt-precorrin-5B (C(1))-methyltransferase [Chloroflexota bacterium]
MTNYINQVPPRNRTGNRTGYTTGSNASAAAKAATIALLTGEWLNEVTISLPIGETATMNPVEQQFGDDWAYCCMVKDAGDDPDVTHGALVCAKVQRSSQTGIQLEGGVGVGRVTLPGIGLPVGDPAINPVPRQQIRENVQDAVDEVAPHYLDGQGLEVIVSVPDGETLAEKTLNARLGILGGISILGTTGKVFAYSTASWRASVIQAVEVAAFNNSAKVVMTTGGRSERFAMSIFPELPDVAFVQLSVFTGAGLETCVRQGVQSAVFVGMIGKMIKTAQGHMTTHVAGNQVDFDFLAQVCRDTNAPDELTQAVTQANTGRHMLELCQEHDFLTPLQRITELALEQCQHFVEAKGGNLALDVILIDFNGHILGRSRGQSHSDLQSMSATPLIERLASDPVAAYDDDEDGRYLTS